MSDFDMIMGRLDQLGSGLHVLTDAVRSLRALAQDKPQWEAVSVAMKTRRKSRKTLMDAVGRGEIERRIEPFPGGQHFLLKVADLDRHFPTQS